MSLKSLDIGATLSRKGLIVQGPVLDGLKVTLAETPATEAAKPAAAKASSQDKAVAKSPVTAKAKPADESKAQQATKAAPIALPAIRLPFPIQLEGLQVTAFRYQQGELIEGLDKLLLSASAEGATSRCASSPCATPWRIWRSRARSSSKTIIRWP